MFYRHHNLKRAMGLLGVVLALLSGVQQGHSFCYLAGCGSSSASLESVDSLAGVCSCPAVCSKRSTSASSTSEGRNVDSPSNSCPCPTTCWCHQPAEPLGLPANASGPVELLAQNVELVTSLVGCDLDSLHNRKTTTSNASLETAMLRCAKLCRFLI